MQKETCCTVKMLLHDKRVLANLRGKEEKRTRTGVNTLKINSIRSHTCFHTPRVSSLKCRNEMCKESFEVNSFNKMSLLLEWAK